MTFTKEMKITVRSSQSPLGFMTEGGGAWKEWDRFITLDGEKAFHMGNICGTCPFFFERHSGANKSLSPSALQQQLTHGITELDADHAKTLEELLPDGEYEMSLRFITPRLVTIGDDSDYFAHEEPDLWGVDGYSGLHDPKTRYFRGQDEQIGTDERLFEFLIPLFPESSLDEDRVSEFGERIEQGGCPTAVAISVLDVKQPADWEGDPEVTCHWSLAHYLIDGHHKVLAAARAGRPISLISMLATEKGISGREHHNKLRRMKRVNKAEMATPRKPSD